MLNVSKERLKEAQRLAVDIIAGLTLTEKVGQLTQFGVSIYGDQLDYSLDHYEDGKIGSYLSASGAKVTNMLQKECEEQYPTHIPLLFAHDVIHGYKTTLPTPLAQSCSWDPEVAKKGAEVAAKEAYVGGLKWTFSPMVDIARDPRWGRIVEGYGEDPYLCSRFAEATVKGYQGEEIGEKYHILACMKHFAGYGNCVGGRDYNEVDMSMRTLGDVYLPSFKAGIDAGAATVMTAYHTLNGIPCTGNRYLMTDVLRGFCGFDGFVISDFAAVHEMIPHGHVENEKEAAYKAFAAGTNMVMAGDIYNDYFPELLEEGRITEEEIDEALLPIITFKILLGLFERPYVDEKEESTTYFCEEHIKVAREAGRDCIVLLENNGVLPLEGGKKVALIGPLADDREHVLGSWACLKEPDKTISILDGFHNAGINVKYAKGCEVHDGSKEELEKAISVATESDVAVLVLGESFEMSGEAHSRADLTIPEAQLKLLDAVIETGTPVVVLISAGRPIVVETFREKVSAIAYIWQLGTATGDAVADIITGKYDVNGRISVSVPRSVGQVPIYYNHPNTGRPNLGKVWYETGYVDEAAYPRYPFGYGLSYTNFELSDLTLSSNTMTTGGSIIVTCKVTNTGERAGKTVVQLYTRDLVASFVRPVKELKGFEKVSLEAGESCSVQFELQAEAMAFHNEKLEKIVEPGKFHLWVGQHSDEESLFAEFCILSN